MTTASTIQGYYATILNRTGSDAEVAGWANLVANGSVTLPQVGSDIVNSFEALNNVAPIVEIYQANLGRVPDQSTLKYWVTSEDSGATTLAQISAFIADSAESQTLYGVTNGVATSASVTLMYQNILGRAPDAGAVTSWLGSGLSEAAIQQAIAATPEANRRAASAVTTFLTSAGQGNPSAYTGSLYAATLKGDTLTLTPGADILTGGVGNNTFNATEIAAALGGSFAPSPTWTTGDSITGGSGSNTFNVTQTAAIVNPLGSTVSNIQTANFLTAAGVTLNTVPWTGLTALNVTGSKGTDSVTAATGTAIAVTNTSASGTTIVGGSSVGATVAGALNISGEVGAVKVTNTGVGATTTIAGGTTVDATVAGTLGISGESGAVKVTNTGSENNTTIAGGTSVNATVAANINVSGETGAIIVNETSTAGATVGVLGGTTVVVNTAGGTVLGGVFTAKSTTTNIGDLPSISTDPTTGAQTVGNLASDPTGDVVVNNSTAFTDGTGASQVGFGSGVATVFTDGATSAYLTGGSPGSAITDVHTTPLKPSTASTAVAGTSTLGFVNLDGVSGNVGITSNALTALTIADSQTGESIGSTGQTGTTNATVTELPAHALALTLSNDASGTTVADATATGITITTAGKKADTIALAAAAATALTFSNTAAVTLAGSPLAAVTTITDTSSGALTLDTSTGYTALTAINAAGSTGAVSATIDATIQTFTGGSGSDVVTLKAVPTKAVAGGSGTNTLVLDFAGPVTAAIPGVTGFTGLGLGSAATGAYNAAGFKSLTLGAVAGDVSFTSVAAGATLAITADPTKSVTYTLANATGTKDSLSLTLGVDGATGTPGVDATSVGINTLTASGIETLNIASVGSGTGTNTINIVDTAATSISVTGDEALTLTAGVGAAVTSITAAGDSNAVDLTNVPLSAFGATVTGGAGLLTATGGAGNDTFTTGSGGGIITAGTGVDTINGGAGLLTATAGTGNDTFTTGSGGGVINVTGTGNGVDTINLSASTAVSDTINIADGSAVPTRALDTITGFTSLASAASDKLTFIGSANASVGNVVSAAASGIASTSVAYTNGIATFGGTGAAGATLAQLIGAVETTVDAAAAVATPILGATAAFVSGGNTYVVHAGTGHTNASDSVVALAGTTGFTSLTNVQPTDIHALWV